MKPYKSEKAFSTAFLTMIRKHCPLVQRIESGAMGRGIPDIYLRFRDTEVWVELKNDNRQSIHCDELVFDWRPGQQAWHHEYWSVCGRPVVTIMACKDGFAVYYTGKKHAPQGIVCIEDTTRCTQLHDLWAVILDGILRR